MSVTVSIEFTDAQWELVTKHFPNFIENEAGALVHQDITVEELQAMLFNNIKTDVFECLMNSAKKEAATKLENCFDV